MVVLLNEEEMLYMASRASFQSDPQNFYIDI